MIRQPPEVDDEPEIRSVLTAFFNKKGYETKEAENGEQALEIARDEDFAVVLCDIDMPVMDTKVKNSFWRPSSNRKT